jgi:hypothetical protein
VRPCTGSPPGGGSSTPKAGVATRAMRQHRHRNQEADFFIIGRITLPIESRAYPRLQLGHIIPTP